MKNCITEESRDTQGYHEEVEILVHSGSLAPLSFLVFVLVNKWDNEDTQERDKAHQNHHQKAVAIS